MNVNPERLIAAREVRSLTQTELADTTKIDQGSISRYESGLKLVPDYDLEAIAGVLDFPPEFFFLPGERHGVESGEIFHRKSRSLPQDRLKVVHAQLNIVRWNTEKLLEHIKTGSKFDIPTYSVREFNGDIEQIAASVRAAWKIPSGAVKNLTERLEAAYCFVHSVDFGINPNLLDETVQWSEPMRPVIFMNNRATGDRLRFSLAHALGHLVMHHNLEPYAEMEEEAQQFASAFLMPAEDIIPDLRSHPLTIERVLQLKPAWKVSMQAIIHRAFDLGVINKVRYTSLFQMLTRSGYRKNEPFSLPIEKPNSFKKLLEIYRGEKLHYTNQEIAQLIGMSERDFINWYLPDEIFGPDEEDIRLINKPKRRSGS